MASIGIDMKENAIGTRSGDAFESRLVRACWNSKAEPEKQWIEYFNMEQGTNILYDE